MTRIGEEKTTDELLKGGEVDSLYLHLPTSPTIFHHVVGIEAR